MASGPIETFLSHHGCGDDTCCCSWAQPVVRGPHAIYPDRMHTRVALEEGLFATDGEGIPEEDIVALAAKWDIPISKRGPVVRGSRPARPDEIAVYEKAVAEHREAVYGKPKQPEAS